MATSWIEDPGLDDLEMPKVRAIVLPGEVEVAASQLEAKGLTEHQGVSFQTFIGADLARE